MSPSVRASIALLALAAVAAHAQTVPPAAPVSIDTVAFTLDDPEMTPTSVGYDPAERAFYVGSLNRRKIVRVDESGAVSDFVPAAQDGIWGVLAIAVDPSRRELLAAACNMASRQPPMVPDDEASRGRTGLFRYDLRTGRLIHKYVVGTRDTPRCFNGVTVTPDGHAFMTAGANGIYRARAEATQPDFFARHDGFLNGIAASADGSHLFLADRQKGVLVMDLASRTVRPLAVPPGEPLQGLDGLYVRRHTLVAVQHGVAPGARVVQAQLTHTLDGVVCVGVADRGRPGFEVLAGGALLDDAFFYVTARRLRGPDGNGTDVGPALVRGTIIRTPLVRGCP